MKFIIITFISIICNHDSIQSIHTHFGYGKHACGKYTAHLLQILVACLKYHSMLTYIAYVICPVPTLEVLKVMTAVTSKAQTDEAYKGLLVMHHF